MTDTRDTPGDPRPPIDVSEIPRQRAKGWPDFHPEDYCHRCGQRNMSAWWVQSELWNAVDGDSFGGGVLCPQCFVELYEAHVGRECIWEVRLDGVAGYTEPGSIARLLERLERAETALREASR